MSDSVALSTDTKTFQCSGCGKEHVFVPFVKAHWDTMFTHTCDCGALHHVRQGIATRAEQVVARVDVSPQP